MPESKFVPTPLEPPFHDERDRTEMDRLRRTVVGDICYDINTEGAEVPKYSKQFDCYLVERMDPRTALTVIDTFQFFYKEAAQAAIDYVIDLKS